MEGKAKMKRRNLVRTANGLYVVVDTSAIENGYETMVFCSDKYGSISNRAYGRPEDEAWYYTETEAETGHKAMVEKWKKNVVV